MSWLLGLVAELAAGMVAVLVAESAADWVVELVAAMVADWERTSHQGLAASKLVAEWAYQTS